MKSSVGIIKWALLYIIAWPMTPFLRSGVVWRLIFIVSLVLCLFKYFQQCGRFPKLFTSVLCFIAILWIINVLFFPVEQYYVKSIAITMFGLCSILFDFNRIPDYRKSMKLPMNILLLSLTIWNISSYLVYLAVPGLTRSMTAGVVENIHDSDHLVYNPLLLNFCLDFSQLYAQLLIAPIVFFSLGNHGNYLNKPISITYLISVIFLILYSGFSTANICLFLCIIGCLLYKKKSVFDYVIQILIILVVAYALKSLIGGYLLRNVTSDYYRYKLEYFFGESSGSAYNFDRAELWMRSLNSFLSYPLGGGSDIGGHSGILDFFGTYGFLFGSFFLWLLYCVLLKIYRKSNVYKKNIVLTYLGIFSICVIFNPIQLSYGVVTFGLLPLLLDYSK